MEYDSVLKLAGRSGIYQVLVFFSLVVVGMYYSAENMSTNFISRHHDPWCRVEQLDMLASSLHKHISIPWQDEENQIYSTYEVYDLPWHNMSAEDFKSWNMSNHRDTPVRRCSEWVYDDTLYVWTVFSKVSLITIVIITLFYKKYTEVIYILSSLLYFSRSLWILMKWTKYIQRRVQSNQFYLTVQITGSNFEYSL